MNKWKALRIETKMNQAEFWAKVGVTQSGGSRYESGRDVPKPTQILLGLMYPHGTGVQDIYNAGLLLNPHFSVLTAVELLVASVTGGGDE